MGAHRILIVEDEEINRRFLEVFLSDSGFETDYAEDGEVAWSMLNENGHIFDAVLLDWRLPKLDGLGLLKRAKADDSLADLPIIMQTANNAEHEIQKAINQGVYYYLTKPYDASLMLSVISKAISDRLRLQRLRSETEKHADAIGLLTAGRFELRTREEADALAILLGGNLPRASAVTVGLLELMVNAIEHGNLELNYADKTGGLASQDWDHRVAERMADPAYGSRQVIVQVARTGQRVRFRIADDGSGFDWRTYLELAPERLFAPHGRGIAMASKMAFSSLTYNEQGNEVIAEVELGASDMETMAGCG